jgi:hypothetical protein
LLVVVSLSSTTAADSTIGVGIGSLYNGLGLNFGRSSDTSLTYASLGCMGASTSRSTNTAGDVVSRDSDYETNCGIGLGYMNFSSLQEKRQRKNLEGWPSIFHEKSRRDKN